MCGRYALALTGADLVVEVNDLRIPPRLDIVPRYNVAPGQDVPVVGWSQGAPVLRRLRWGWVARGARPKAPRPVNARSETAATHPMFRDAFARRRCLVPATGFYEWRREGRARTPFLVAPASERLWMFAALWSRAGEGETELRSVVVLTEAANETVRALHDRMPVIVPREDWDAWLRPDTDLVRVRALLGLSRADVMTIRSVSPRVNDVRHDDAGLLDEAPELRSGL